MGKFKLNYVELFVHSYIFASHLQKTLEKEESGKIFNAEIKKKFMIQFLLWISLFHKWKMMMMAVEAQENRQFFMITIAMMISDTSKRYKTHYPNDFLRWK
jgi:hypothetical protein